MNSSRMFHAGAALVFVASVALTIYGCASMLAMPGMEMPGGWTMTMAWMPMPGQSMLEAFGVFIAMWLVMMVAMMMPVLVPLLSRHRPGSDSENLGISAGYFMTWTGMGVVIYPIGVFAADLAMRWPALSRVAPLLAGAAMVAIGMSQFSRWKSRRLQACARLPAAGTPWLRGMRLGWRCVGCCAGPTAMLVMLGVMDLRIMALVGAAILLERLAPGGIHWARAAGILAALSGLLVIARAGSIT